MALERANLPAMSMMVLLLLTPVLPVLLLPPVPVLVLLVQLRLYPNC
jgi:hypothetical protein